MSVKAVTWVFDHSPYTLATRLVHLAIADVANEDNDWRVWISQSHIARKARVGRGTVSSSLKRMVDDGALVLIEKRRGHPSVYRMEGVQNLTPPPGGCAHIAQGGARSTESHLLPTEKEQKGSDGKDSDPLRGFDIFWKDYPRRDGVKDNRKQAVEQWRKLTLEDRRAAYRAMLAYAEACNSGRSRAADAFRWLRDRRWVDWADAEETDPLERTVTNPEVPFDQEENFE